MTSLKANSLFRQGMSEFHTWFGLVFGWLLFVIFLTGTLSIFAQELTYWMEPEIRQAPAMPLQTVASADKTLRQLAPTADMWMLELPQKRHPDLEAVWRKGNAQLERHLDPGTGRILPVRNTEGGEFFAHFHYELHSGKAGLWLVSLASAVMLAALVSGIVIRKQVFKEFFAFHWRKSWFSAHTMTGVLTLPFVALITYTGLTIVLFLLLPVPQVLYGSAWKGPALIASQNFDRPPAKQPGTLISLTSLLPQAEQELGQGKIAFVRVAHPGDRQAVVTFYRTVDDTVTAMSEKVSFDGVTGQLLGSQHTWTPAVTIYRTLVGLHVARFGGYLIPWLYFIAGLASCVMIATGLIFFTVKRRSRYLRSELTRITYRSIEALNITAVLGSSLACVGYLWGNRLLPTALTDRSSTEITVFFSLWFLSLLHACFRPSLQAWREQTGVFSLLCLGLPVINALTSHVGLIPSLSAGDWLTAGVDLTALALGLASVIVFRQLTVHVRTIPAGSAATKQERLFSCKTYL